MSKESEKRKKFRNQGIITIIRELIQSIVSLTVLFLAAGTFNWWNGRVYLFVIILHHIGHFLFLFLYNRTLFTKRAEIFTENTKKYDKVFVYCFIILALLLYTIAGLDAVRFNWSSLNQVSIIVGILIFMIGWIIGIWAMIVNQNFTMTISIEKNQYICSTGPYKIIRHPGYAGEIIIIIGFPLILGSVWSYIPATLLIFVFIIRTHLEDKVLRLELKGYDKYSKITKYRLFPFIW